MSLKSSFSWIGIILITIVLFLMSCSTSTHIEKDKDANLSQYKTYSWAEKERSKNGSHMNDMAEQNLKTAVDEQLKQKGLKEVKENPDVLISTDLLLEKSLKQQNDPVYSQSFTRTYMNPRTGRLGTLYYPSQFMGYDSYATTVKEGTVIVTVIDAKKDRAIWQGWSTKLLNSHNGISKNEINNNVRSIFKKFDTK